LDLNKLTDVYDRLINLSEIAIAKDNIKEARLCLSLACATVATAYSLGLDQDAYSHQQGDGSLPGTNFEL
jgi:hypothetical protein